MDSGLCNRCILYNAIASNAPCSGMCPAKKGLDGHIVPHGRIERKTHVYKVGRNNALALSPQLSNQGPLIRGPFTCQPPSCCHVAPLGRPRGLATCHRHLRGWVRVGLPRGLACNVAYARVPCITSTPRVLWRLKTPFLHF